MTDALTKTQDFAELVGYDIGQLQRYLDPERLSALLSKLDAVLVTAPVSATATASTVATRQVETVQAVTDYRQLAGFDCNTGKLIRGIDYLRQRITNALTTRKGSQPLLRARGSDIPELIDQPMNPRGNVTLISALATALADKLSGVPDFSLSRISLLDFGAIQGKFGYTLTGTWYGENVEVTV